MESALQKDGIPNRIIGGLKFFERMEVKDLLAYLQLADNPNFTVGFSIPILYASTEINAKAGLPEGHQHA